MKTVRQLAITGQSTSDFEKNNIFNLGIQKNTKFFFISGLGKSLAFELYKRGAQVILLARSTEKLKEICEELKETFPLNQNEPIY